MKWILILGSLLWTCVSLAEVSSTEVSSIETSSTAAPSASLTEVKTKFEGNTFVSQFIFDKPLQENFYNLDFINKTVQIDFPGLQIQNGRQSKQIKRNGVRNLYVYQTSKDVLRTRFIYENTKAEKLKSAVKIFAEGSVLTVKITNSNPTPIGVNTNQKTTLANALPEKKPIKEEKIEDKNLKTPDVSGALAQASIAKNKEKNEVVKASEDQIPVFKKRQEEKKNMDAKTHEVLLSLVVIFMFLIGGIVVVRKWFNKKQKFIEDEKIQVLTQHYLGPKKSLAIVQVGAHNILIGVTDQNINMIKTLSTKENVSPEQDLPNWSGPNSNWNQPTPSHSPTHPPAQSATQASAQSTLEAVPTETEATEQNQDVSIEDEFSVGDLKEFLSKRLKGMREM